MFCSPFISSLNCDPVGSGEVVCSSGTRTILLHILHFRTATVDMVDIIFYFLIRLGWGFLPTLVDMIRWLLPQ